MSGLPPPAIEETVISGGLSSTLLGVFLTGIYTMVYFGTVYIYLSRKLEHSNIVIFTITMLFILSIANLGIQWYLAQWAFADNGDSRDDIFITYYGELGRAFWLILANDICAYITTVLADVLLIWRCFHIWGRSFRVISLPLFLLFAEIGMYFFTTIFPFAKQKNANLSVEEKMHLNQITCAALFVSFGCTLAATSLIAYRIYPIFKQDHSRGRFKKILDVLIQSAAAYAITSLLEAIVTLVSSRLISSAEVIVAGSYINTLFTVTSGLAPTLVVTRIALIPDNTEVSTTPHLSVLQFQGRSTHQTTSRMDSTSFPLAGDSGSVRGEAEKETA